jgi:predicted permease
MKDQETMLKMMKFWLFGTFIIIIAATTVFIGGVLGTGLTILSQANYWFSVITTAVLCVLWYYIYRWYLGRSS